jgi:hypothetical protein
MQGYQEQAKVLQRLAFLMLVKILLASTYLLDVSLYQPT